MPNWCYTTYKVDGNKKQVDKLKQTIDELKDMEKPLVKSDFGNLWLGCLVTILGGDWGKQACRGEIIDYDIDDDVLTINMEVAWCEPEGLRDFLKSKLPGINIYVSNEESGWGIYNTNDKEGKYFPERYYIDGYPEENYFETLEDAAKWVSEITGKEVHTEEEIEDACDEYEDPNNGDAYLSYHKFNIID